MKRLFPILLIGIVLLCACGKATATQTATLIPTVTTTPLPPTPTSLPMALRVNGEGVLLSDYQAELARLVQAQTTLNQVTTSDDQKNKVIQNYEDQLLLAQTATKAGFSVDDATLQARIDKLVTQIGGADKLSAWESANGYTDDSFRTALRREILAAWQRDQIINAVPTTADQIHALQILTQDEANANVAYQSLQDGKDFATLAKVYDPTNGGDLGWFAAGTLTQPEVDAAAFALQPGQYSTVIKSVLGYHIIYVVARDPQHPLSVDARRILQEAALNKWLSDARTTSTIEVLVQ
jgi:parvulin-like peptidyl-prolyl isomerase